MSASELQRLALALRQDSALRETLDAGLAQCRSAEEAAALLQRHGYAVDAAALQAAGAALPDTALDGVAGGTSTGGPGSFLGGIGPFADILDKIGPFSEMLLPFSAKPPG
ncbi:Nif11-like leader peptide family natural product precursor [Pseudoroseomonas cervicalis]|uniref:Nif11-like leader peptide family natural product precursor n=1 Tax=Teichococcus cervicalis TaxID=204525 RepID=UPI002784FAE1|nr:Nif11-like leader peptide family natural product precursor [Pseudoroseomonas cervicalis]MDQ1080996.1 hypothetical protein [Pseudoroseomonas cervicalis]